MNINVRPSDASFGQIGFYFDFIFHLPILLFSFLLSTQSECQKHFALKLLNQQQFKQQKH